MKHDLDDLDVAVVGGGLSGLVCACEAARAGAKVALFEAAPDFGGAMRTVRDQGMIADGGALQFALTDDVREVAEAAGASMVEASPAAAKRYIYDRKRLVALAPNPAALLASPLLAPGEKLRALGEPLQPRRADDADESVAEFFTRRFGRGVVDALVAPVMAGIFAGDVDRLSARAALPDVVALERDGGSVLRGLAGSGNLRRRAKSGAVAGGNDALPRALAAALEGNAYANACVSRMTLRGARISLVVEGVPGGHAHAAQVVLATSAPSAATLLEMLEPDAAEALREIRYAPLAQIVLAYPHSAIGVPLDGFGFLVTPRSKISLIGCVWSSVCFPDRAPEGVALVTAFVGGMHHPKALELPDAALADQVHGHLSYIMKIRRMPPSVVAGFRWEAAIPQYDVGHDERRARVEKALKRLPNVRLCGNYFGGPGVPDSVARARATAREISSSG